MSSSSNRHPAQPEAGKRSLDLYAWGAGWGLFSLDPDCLAVQAYCVLAAERHPEAQLDARLTFHECSNPQVSPSGMLPLLLVGRREALTGPSAILEYLASPRAGHLDLDAALSPCQRATSAAYRSLVQDTLQDALLHTRWLDAENYLQTTRPRIAGALSFLARYSLPGRLRERAVERCRPYGLVPESQVLSKGAAALRRPDAASAATGMGGADGADAKALEAPERPTPTGSAPMISEVYLIAKQGYAALDQLLGDQDYFLGGSQPTTLDAVAYGHLAHHAIPSLAHPVLFALLTFQFPRLVAFVHRMQARLEHVAPPALLALLEPKARVSWRQWVMDTFPLHLLLAPAPAAPGAHREQAGDATEGGEESLEVWDRRRRFYNWAAVLGTVGAFALLASRHLVPR